MLNCTNTISNGHTAAPLCESTNKENVAKGKNLNTENDSKLSVPELNAAFVLAVKKHNCEDVHKLIQAGAQADTPISYTWTAGDCDWDVETTALVYAIRHNLPNMVKILIKTEKSLNKALDLAIEQNYPDVVEELIIEGADINYLDEDNNNPLIKAIMNGSAGSEFSSSPRVRNCWLRSQRIIQALLKAGANVSQVNKQGRTALMEAVIEHDLHTVQNLLQIPQMTEGSFFGFGAKPINYVDNDGNTALILALENMRYSYIGTQEYQLCVNSQEIIKALLAIPGIDTKHVNNNGDTASSLFKEADKKVQAYPY